MVNKICDLSYFPPSAHLESNHLCVPDVGQHIHLNGDFFSYMNNSCTIIISLKKELYHSVLESSKPIGQKLLMNTLRQQL